MALPWMQVVDLKRLFVRHADLQLAVMICLFLKDRSAGAGCGSQHRTGRRSSGVGLAYLLSGQLPENAGL